jgi:hypothetical protein
MLIPFVAAALLPYIAATTPTPSALPVRSVTLPAVEFASAYTSGCPGAAQPPFAHPANTVFVGAVAHGQTICTFYQGLVRFDLDGLDAASIASARLYYAAKQNYSLNGSTEKGRAVCLGSIGTVAQPWNADEKALTSTLSQRDALRPPHVNLNGPPIDITAFLRAHLEDVKSNGFAFDGAVGAVPAHYCFAALGQIELRLGISGAL